MLARRLLALALPFGLLACSGGGGGEGMDVAGDIAPVVITRAEPSKTIVAGQHQACFIGAAGVLKCWGRNDFGQLGLGDKEDRGEAPGEMGANLPAVDLGAGRRVRQVALGRWHSCAILDDDSVKCWGRNNLGQLGLGDKEDRGDAPGEMGDNLPAVDLGTGRTAKRIALGSWHSCAVLDDDTLKCWGVGEKGQTGRGSGIFAGDEPGEMGDALPTVALDQTAKVVDVAAGVEFTCALLNTGVVKCFGANEDGQLGIGNRINQGDGPREMGNLLPPVNLGTGRTAKAIVTEGNHSCATLDDDTVKCWGDNVRGVLGLGDTNGRGADLAEMGDNLPPVDLGTGRTVRAVDAGRYGNCALLAGDGTSGGAVKCWGANAVGDLGLGDLEDRGDNPGEMGDALPEVNLGTGATAKEVAAGEGFACALLEDNTLKCWGWNGFGQLGQGDSQNRGGAPTDMGDALPAFVP